MELVAHVTFLTTTTTLCTQMHGSPIVGNRPVCFITGLKVNKRKYRSVVGKCRLLGDVKTLRQTAASTVWIVAAGSQSDRHEITHLL